MKTNQLINENIETYLAASLEESETLSNEKKFGLAITVINEALSVLPDEASLLAKKERYVSEGEAYKEEQRKLMIEELKENQELEVLSVKMVTTGTYIDFYHAQVIVQNNSDKVIKEYTVGIVGYDSNGYPLQLDYGDYLMRGRATAANIQPGDTFGKNTGWDIYGYDEEKVRTLLVCVDSVTYYDGTTWENPY